MKASSNASSSPLLNLEHVSVNLGHTPILKDVSFSVNAGEAISMIGPNGAGKTTLLKTILGFYPCVSGEIRLNGERVRQATSKQRAQWMAYVPQHHHFNEFGTVREFVSMGRYPHLSVFQAPTQQDQYAIEEAMRYTGVQALVHRQLDTLSGGEQQKVIVAAALAQQPQLLLLDEPATFLDPKNQVEIQRLLLEINRKTGTTLLAITHDLNHAIQASHRIIALKAGQVVFNDAPQALANAQVLELIFETPFQLIPNSAGGLPLVFPKGGSFLGDSTDSARNAFEDPAAHRAGSIGGFGATNDAAGQVWPENRTAATQEENS